MRFFHFGSFLLSAVLILAGTVNGAQAADVSRLPRAMLWAWQRSENLQYINPQKFGVAFLRQTITINGDRISVSPRQQPLKVPANTCLLSVSRIEVDDRARAAFTREQVGRITHAVVQTATGPGVIGVQIDFDARLSERPFYIDVLRSVRRGLPKTSLLTMTALSSWCTFDPWLRDADVDEIVPMYFSMGADKRNILAFLKEGKTLQLGCKNCLGLSIDDLTVARSVAQSTGTRADKRIYFFSTMPWSIASYREAEKLLSN